jgi:hypothetical protein
MKFELTELEIERKDKFYAKCKKKLKDKDVHLSYHFFPTGIGTTVKVKSESLNIELDITDLNDW